MPSFKIELKGLNEALKKIDVKEVKDNVNKALLKFGLNVERDAKQLAPVDEGRLRNAIFQKMGDLEVSVGCTVYYAAYIEFGTRKFAAEHVASLPNDWQTFASQFKGGADDNAAYVIARKIVTQGIRPQPFLYPAVEKNRPQLIKDIEELINK